MLPGYIRRKVRFSDYPGITPAAASASVRGTYVRGLTDGDMWRLGIFEGSQYEQRKVRVRLLIEENHVKGKGSGVGTYVEGEEVEADTYVFIAEEEGLEEGEWDFAEFKRSKLARWTGLNEEYEGE